ncbi:MAG: AAA family ATPase [Sandaracinaceae bacterium]
MTLEHPAGPIFVEGSCPDAESEGALDDMRRDPLGLERSAEPGAMATQKVRAVPLVSGALSLPPTLYENAELRSLRSRALAYARAGVAVHFRGRAGMGKTTLALEVARALGRPVALVTGDHALDSARLLGHAVGEDTVRTHDRYVQRVTRTQASTRTSWSDGILTTALAEGHTLVYDEFTRTPAETNNVLLSALEERLLVLTTPLREQPVIRAHAEFRVILTSNPDEYAGVGPAPDALLDRMVTFEVRGLGAVAEAAMIAARTGIPPEDAAVVARLVDELRRSLPPDHPPSLRTAVMIGRLLRALGIRACATEDRFVQVCLDVLGARLPPAPTELERSRYRETLRARIVEAARRSPDPATQAR